MDSPAHERRSVEEYLRSQSGDGLKVEHVEKLTSEYALGGQYDVWDAHTNEGRWWVITNPMNLYRQDQIKSMDVALSFHIGLTARVMAMRPTRHERTGDGWLLEVFERLGRAADSLDRAKEVEEFQAVGMRLREALVSLASGFASLELVEPEGEAPKRADFKAWAGIAAASIASGAESAELRGLLKGVSEKTWAFVNWLTHARRASRQDATIALGATTHVVESFVAAIQRWRLGEPARCPVCASYQLRLDYDDVRGWLKRCSTCGWSADAEPPSSEPLPQTEQPAEVEGECVTLDDFAIYVSAQQARGMFDGIAERIAGGESHWENPFTRFHEGRVIDAHRLTVSVYRQERVAGAELICDCGDDSCINPDHTTEVPLPSTDGWVIGLIEQVVARERTVELGVTSGSFGACWIAIDRDVFDRVEIADIGDLLERPVWMSPSDSDGSTSLVIGASRRGYRASSVMTGAVRFPPGSSLLQPG